jgi:gas vesicle protein
MSTINSALPRLLAVTALAGGLAFAGPVFAADASSMTSTSTTSTTTTKHHKPMGEDVETRIKTLHDKLQITSDQEDAWNTVAQTMRDNETTIKAAVDARRENAETATAIEDLQSHQKIMQAYADAAGKLVDAFTPLYNSFSDTQKKNADEVFGRFEGHRAPASK